MTPPSTVLPCAESPGIGGAQCKPTATADSDNATRTSSSSHGSILRKSLVETSRGAVRQRRVTNRQAKLSVIRPNSFAGRHLQQALGGEENETYICIDWSCCSRRRCARKRHGIRNACRACANLKRRGPGRLRLQRVGPLLASPLLAPSVRRLWLLPSALLGRMGLAPPLLAPQLVSVASLAQLEHRRLIRETRKGREPLSFLGRRWESPSLLAIAKQSSRVTSKFWIASSLRSSQ